ncbi:MAG: SHOCT domain-containing protein [Solirubrobacterales bacterium]
MSHPGVGWRRLGRTIMFGRHSKKTRERLQATGLRAPATVLEISGGHLSVTTGNPQLAANTEVPMKVTLRIEPEGEPPFEVETKLTFPQLGIPRRGGSVPVIYDPEDRDTVILDQSVEGGLGIAAGALRERAGSEDRPDLGSVADLVEQASAGGGLDVEGLQRSLREQFGAGSAGAMPDLSAFGFPAQPREEDPVDKLAKLAELKEKGLLTEAEFNAQKARILGET